MPVTPANFAAHFGNKLYDWGHVTVRSGLSPKTRSVADLFFQTKQKLASDRPFSWAR